MEREIVLITGASSGFGLYTALRLAQNGYHVIATLRDPSKQHILINKAINHHVDQRIEIFPLDVTKHEERTKLINKIVEKYSYIDILINNAGYCQGGFIEQLNIDDWENQFNTNFFSAVALTKLALPIMRNRKKGKVLFLGSISGRIGLPGMGAYAASKFALEGFCESLRLEVKPFNIHVSIIEAGSFRTNIWKKAFSQIGSPVEEDYSHLFQSTFSTARQSADQAGDPMEVVNLITRICKEKRPKLRYQIGKGVKSTVLLKSLVPWSIFEWLVHKKINR